SIATEGSSCVKHMPGRFSASSIQAPMSLPSVMRPLCVRSAISHGVIAERYNAPSSAASSMAVPAAFPSRGSPLTSQIRTCVSIRITAGVPFLRINSRAEGIVVTQDRAAHRAEEALPLAGLLHGRKHRHGLSPFRDGDRLLILVHLIDDPQASGLEFRRSD